MRCKSIEPASSTVHRTYKKATTTNHTIHRASTATIARIPYVKTLNDTDDFLYATAEVAIWSACELGLGMTAANCAVLRPLFRKFLPALGFNSSGGRSSSATHLKGNTAPETGKRQSSRNEGLELGDVRHGKGFGTLTSAWHPEEHAGEDRDDDSRSSHSQTMIINTKTSVYRSEETAEDSTDWKRDH